MTLLSGITHSSIVETIDVDGICVDIGCEVAITNRCHIPCVHCTIVSWQTAAYITRSVIISIISIIISSENNNILQTSLFPQNEVLCFKKCQYVWKVCLFHVVASINFFYNFSIFCVICINFVCAGAKIWVLYIFCSQSAMILDCPIPDEKQKIPKHE